MLLAVESGRPWRPVFGRFGRWRGLRAASARSPPAGRFPSRPQGAGSPGPSPSCGRLGNEYRVGDEAPRHRLTPMSDFVSHECGVALVRLLKPLSYYQEKYGTPLWGFTKLFLLMEKQHNRGQDGAGVACVKLNVTPGEPFMFRERNVKSNPLDRIFKQLLGAVQRQGLLGGHPPRVHRDGEEELRLRRRALPGPPALRHERRLQPERLPPLFPAQPLGHPQPGALRELQPHEHGRAQPVADRDRASIRCSPRTRRRSSRRSASSWTRSTRTSTGT